MSASWDQFIFGLLLTSITLNASELNAKRLVDCEYESLIAVIIAQKNRLLTEEKFPIICEPIALSHLIQFVGQTSQS